MGDVDLTLTDADAVGSSSLEGDLELPTRDHRRYQLIGEHARGGLGRVLRMRDADLGRTVAIKELLEDNPVHEERFVREALLTSRLEHPSIVPVYDAGRWPDGHPFYSMKLVSGQSLRDVIGQARTFEERLGLLPHVIAVADAMAYAHSHRVIHRDLKPSNVIVGAYGETVVVDWGLAKETGASDPMEPAVAAAPYRAPGDNHLTSAGSVVGTPAYMPPEQARGEPVDTRVDVYAIGAILYHLLSGRPPYSGDGSASLVARVIASGPDPLEALAPQSPTDLLTIIAKAMARSPDERYADAKELAADLRRFQAGQLVSAHRYSLRQLLLRWARTHRYALAVAAVAVMTLAIVGGLSVRRILDERRRADSNASLATTRLAESYFEQGRRAFLDADYRQAVSNLREAMRLGIDRPALRFLLARSLTPFDAQQAQVLPGSRLWEVTYSKDGALIATAGAAGAHVYTSTGAPVAAFTDGEVNSARFSPDGSLLITGGEAGAVGVWSVVERRRVSTPLSRDVAVNDTEFSPDGSLAIAAATDGTLYVWSTSDWSQRGAIATEQGHLWRAAFSPDGAWIATAGDNGEVRLWSSADLTLHRTLAAHTSGVRNLDFSASSRKLVTAGRDRRAIVWDLETGEPLLTLTGHANRLVSARFSPDERLVVTSGIEPVVRVWNAETGALVSSLRGHTGVVYWAAFLPDSETVVTASWDGTARLWSAGSGREVLRTAGHEGPVVWAAISPTGSSFATSSWDGSARIWSTSKRSQLSRTTITNSAINAIGQLPDGSIAAAANDGVFIRPPDATVRKLATSGPGNYDVAVHPSEPILVAVGEGGLHAWHLESSASLLSVPAEHGAFEGVDYSPDGTRLVTAADDGTVELWNAATGASILRIDAHEGYALDASFSPDGSRILTAGSDNTARLWDSHTGAELAELRGHSYAIRRATFCTADLIATASYDGTAALWDAHTGERLMTTDNLGAEVMSISCSPDGALLAAAAGERALVFDTTTGAVLAIFEGHLGSTNHVAFAPSAPRLLTAGSDGSTVSWDVSVPTSSQVATQSSVPFSTPGDL